MVKFKNIKAKSERHPTYNVPKKIYDIDIKPSNNDPKTIADSFLKKISSELKIPQDLSRATTFSDDTITDPKERAKIFGQYDHVRVYGRDYFDKLRSIGFKVLEEDYTTKLSPELVEKYCLAKGEIIPICYK